MDQKAMIDDLVKMLDAGMTQGVGHVNIEFDTERTKAKQVQTMKCSDSSRPPLP